MNDQPISSGGEESSGSQEFQPRESSRHRRSDRRDSRSNSRGGSQRSSHRSKARQVQLNHQMMQRLIIGGCCLLALVGIFFVGFLFGEKVARGDDSTHKNIVQEAEFPSPDSEALLDKGFEEMGNGEYRQAMLNFQKVQDIQPTLTGVDYLVAESAFKAGEDAMAEDAANHAVSKNEAADDARVLLALLDLNKSKVAKQDDQFADPYVTAETAIHHLAAAHPADAKVYVLWGDLLRANGSYRKAAEIYQKGVLRAVPDANSALLSAKEQIARLENEPPKEAPSLSGLTAMNAEQSLTAALASLQQHKSEDAAAFLERARDLYPPQIFRELIKDPAFADYTSDPELKKFFKPDHSS